MKRLLVLASLATALTTVPALAQTAGKVGFDFRAGDQNAVGVTWHITDMFALRPLVTYNSWEEVDYDPYYYYPYEYKVVEYGVDLGFLFTVHSHDKLDLYTGAALQYYYANPDYGASMRSWGGQLLFGMRYPFSDHFAIFGEAGARYRKEEYPYDQEEYGLFTGGLGLIIYVN